MRRLAALLWVISAAAFVIGVSAERSAEKNNETHQSEVPTVTTGESTGEHNENGEEGGGESAGHREATVETPVAQEGASEGTETHNDNSEKIFGINPESKGLAAAAVAVSLLLAAAVWAWGTPAILVVTVVLGLLFAALDVREAFHQADASRSGLVALALLIAVLHLGVAIAAGLALKQQRTGETATAGARA
jgi:hypothetical protein